MAEQRKGDMDGNAPDNAMVALLIVDMINDFEFPGGDVLFEAALPVAKRLAALKRNAQEAHIPVIYANDNFGKWRSDFQSQVRHCLNDNVRGEPIVRTLLPDAEDYVVLKPKHSAFYATPLEALLTYLHVRTLVLTGVAGDNCILFTASDAFMRGFRLLVPLDGVASLDPNANVWGLQQMQTTLDADLRFCAEIDFEKLNRNGEQER